MTSHGNATSWSRVVLGRFGSFQKGETILDDRPRTTDHPGRLWIVSDRAEFYPDDSLKTTQRRPETAEKTIWKLLETIPNDPIRPRQILLKLLKFQKVAQKLLKFQKVAPLM